MLPESNVKGIIELLIFKIMNSKLMHALQNRYLLLHFYFIFGTPDKKVTYSNVGVTGRSSINSKEPVPHRLSHRLLFFRSVIKRHSPGKSAVNIVGNVW